VLIVGLLHGHTALQAQPTSEPSLTDGDGKPWTQGVSTEDRQAARELFLEGNRRFRIPLFAKAAEKYTAALTKWKHPAIYFNLALAQLNIGQEVEARDNLEHALQYGEEPLGAEQFQEAQKQFQEIDHALGWIHIVCATKGAEVTLDGVKLFTGPGSYQGRAKAKAYEVAAKKAGYLSLAKRVTITPSGFQDIELRLLTLNEAADASRRWALWKPWAVLAVGAAVTAGSGGLHALSARNFQAYDKRFHNLPCAVKVNVHGCNKDEIDPALNAQLNRALFQQKIALAGYIAGGSLVAAGIAFVYLNRPRLAEQGASMSAGMRAIIAPVVSVDMIGALVTVSY